MTWQNSYIVVTGLDGKAWYVDPSNLAQLPAPMETAALTGITTLSPIIPMSDLSTEYWKHAGFMAFEEARTTVDWKNYVKSIKDHIIAANPSMLPSSQLNPNHS